jgi:hypothetical protein
VLALLIDSPDGVFDERFIFNWHEGKIIFVLLGEVLIAATDIAAWVINCGVKIFTGPLASCAWAKPATDKAKALKHVFNNIFFIIYFLLI